ncbi:uncharacterized protein METZ01_LOCUS101799 [marine metagenome]|uniref:Uncharacterized protein n=1 Tax=marine metagenome TaxID=408172 RepID=A0A381W8X3_9ZZZZ|nr:DUF6152 family protein [Pseudomonadota bacterium]
MKALSNKFTNVTVGLAALVCASPAVLAHHSAVAFDPDSSVEVRGKVTQFIWRSPHLSINMDVTNDDGTIVLWKIEGQSIATMVAAGFDRTVMAEGDVITARVHPMRNGEPGGLLQGLISADGVAYSMDGPETPEQQRQVIPSLTAHIPPPAGETWQEREKKTRPRELPIISEGLGAGDSASTGLAAGTLDPSNLNKERPDAFFDLTGVWQYRGEDQWRANYGSYEFKPGPIFTAKGQAFYDAYQEAAAKGERFVEPTAFCYPAGMPRMMTRYGSLMMLQYPTAIFMVSRLSNEYRVIYLDGRSRVPDNYLDRNWGGESVGHWEGDTLIVETEGFTDENHLMQAGVVTGSQLRIVERIQMLNDGNTLMTEYTFVDPEHWVGEWKHTKFRDRVLKSDVKEANCLYQDNLALPGLGN